MLFYLVSLLRESKSNLLYRMISDPFARAGKEARLIHRSNRLAKGEGLQEGETQIGLFGQFGYVLKRSKWLLSASTTGHAATGAVFGALLAGPIGGVIGGVLGFVYGSVLALGINKLIESSVKQTDASGKVINEGAVAGERRLVRTGAIWVSLLAAIGVGLALTGIFTIPGLAMLGATKAAAAQGALGGLFAVNDLAWSRFSYQPKNTLTITGASLFVLGVACLLHPAFIPACITLLAAVTVMAAASLAICGKPVKHEQAGAETPVYVTRTRISGNGEKVKSKLEPIYGNPARINRFVRAGDCIGTYCSTVDEFRNELKFKAEFEHVTHHRSPLRT